MPMVKIKYVDRNQLEERVAVRSSKGFPQDGEMWTIEMRGEWNRIEKKGTSVGQNINQVVPGEGLALLRLFF